MQCIERYDKYHEEDLDKIIMWIKSGNIKCGKYAHLVKIDKHKVMKGKELFKDAANKDSDSKPK